MEGGRPGSKLTGQEPGAVAVALTGARRGIARLAFAAVTIDHRRWSPARIGRRSPLVAVGEPPGLGRSASTAAPISSSPQPTDRRRRRSSPPTCGLGGGWCWAGDDELVVGGGRRPARRRSRADGTPASGCCTRGRPRVRARRVGAGRGRVRDRARRRVRRRDRAARRIGVAGAASRMPTTPGIRRGRPTDRRSRGTSGICPTCRGTSRASCVRDDDGRAQVVAGGDAIGREPAPLRARRDAARVHLRRRRLAGAVGGRLAGAGDGARTRSR